MIQKKQEILASSLPALYDLAEENFDVSITTGEKRRHGEDTYVDVLLESDNEDHIYDLLTATACVSSGLPLY